VNDWLRRRFARRPGQVVLQTWHGTPLKRLGFDASATQGAQRRFDRRWPAQVANWQYVLSPNRFSTDVLRSAYRLEGELLETGLPRNDVLAGPRRDEVRARVRERLGLAPQTRAILYAPTFRDGVIDRDNHYRLDLHLDAERLRGTLGPDAVVLFRKHHYIVDPVPVTADGFVRDVSAYPDGTELLAAADVLVTDYSSMMFDFANTGRPMLFFAYDLEEYAKSIRGFYLDFEEIAPGPIVRTTDELAAALRDLDGVRARYAERYAAYVQRFCDLDDGGAAARVVDRVFGSA
jgi:CDP-glycerol glycerophosphotransferase